MRKVSDYRRHAEECRVLARNADSAEQCEQLLNMAATWESLAEEREKNLRNGLTVPVDGDAVDIEAFLPRS